MIDAVVDRFADFAATNLVTLTHRQAPWRDVDIPNMNKEITQEAIKRYFNEK